MKDEIVKTMVKNFNPEWISEETKEEFYKRVQESVDKTFSQYIQYLESENERLMKAINGEGEKE